jgi:hypothetical protein
LVLVVAYGARSKLLLELCCDLPEAIRNAAPLRHVANCFIEGQQFGEEDIDSVERVLLIALVDHVDLTLVVNNWFE